MTTPLIGRARHGLRCRSARLGSFAAVARVKLGLAIGQLVFSFQRRARDLMGRGAGGRHSKKGLPEVLCECVKSVGQIEGGTWLGSGLGGTSILSSVSSSLQGKGLKSRSQCLGLGVRDVDSRD